MKVTAPGNYRLTRDFVTRGAISVGTIPSGTLLEITQVDSADRKVIAPQLFDWTHWELPVESVSELSEDEN